MAFGWGLSALGQFERAIAEGQRAVELDPLSLVINTDLGQDFFYARRYDEAIAQFTRRSKSILAFISLMGHGHNIAIERST